MGEFDRIIDLEAQRRTRLHNGHASSRPLSEGFERVGLAGEFEFGKLCGLMPDLSMRPSGDGGIDFRVSITLTVDVKTARNARYLIHEQGKPMADIYVLCEYDSEMCAARMLGWEWGRTLRQAPTRDFGHGFASHYLLRAQLRPMCALERMLKR